jgi:TolA-binding protein
MNEDLNDEKWNEALRDLAQEYHKPPMIVPREAMWASIVAGQRRHKTLSWRRFAPLAAAAVVLLAVGVGLGRWSATKGGVTPIRQTAMSQAVPEAYAIATTQQLVQAQALLTEFSANDRDAKTDARLASWARDLLSNTRLLLGNQRSRCDHAHAGSCAGAAAPQGRHSGGPGGSMKIALILAAALLGLARPARAQLAESAIIAVGAFPDDPADSLYTAARAALAERQYTKAAELFHEITTKYPGSTYAGTASYYEAFARYRLGDTDNLKISYRLLSASATTGDAKSLRAQVCQALVRKGDSSCKQQLIVDSNADTLATPTGDAHKCLTDDDDDNDVRIDALNALMNVDPEKAMPILRTVLARRDACSAVLRRKAVFLVSQKAGSDGADLLLATARTDPDEDVREQAVFWLSQVHDSRAVGMLDSLLLYSTDDGIREKALFALSQQHGSAMLRDFAQREAEPEELREKAYFWLGQSNDPEDRQWLRAQFAREKDEDLKEKIIFDVSQHHEGDTGQWLMGIAADASQSDDIRKKAVFWAAQSNLVTVQQLVALYSKVHDDEDLAEGLIFDFGQMHETAATDELMTIARSDPSQDRRKKAVFWLGQSHDPRVIQFLTELINK